MANIPLSTIPQLSQSPYQAGINPSAGTAPGRAMTQLGGQIRQSGSVLDRYADRKQKLIDNAALADAQNRATDAAAKVESFITEHPDEPERWDEYRLGVYEENFNGQNYEGVSDVAIEQLQQYRNKVHTESASSLGVRAEKRGIEMKNASILRAAQRQVRNGNRSAGMELFKTLEMPGDEKIALIEESMSQGMYQEVLGEIQTAELDQLPEIIERLETKGAGDQYAYYEETYDTGDPNNPITFGLSAQGRGQLLNMARSQHRQRSLRAYRGVRRAQDAIVKGEEYVIEPDMTDQHVVALEQLERSYTDGLTETSAEFEEVESKITTATLDYGLFQGFRERNSDWFEDRWAEIAGGRYDEDGEWVEDGPQFNRQARALLMYEMLNIEAENIADNAEELEGQFRKHKLSDGEKRARVALNNQVKRLVRASAEDPMMVPDPAPYARAYRSIQDAIRNRFSDPKTAPTDIDAFINDELQTIISNEMSPVLEEKVDRDFNELFGL